MKEVHERELNQVKQNNELKLNQLEEELSKVKKKNELLQIAQKEQQKICDELKRGQTSIKTDIDKAPQSRFAVYRQHFSHIPSGRAVIIHYSLANYCKIVSHAPR